MKTVYHEITLSVDTKQNAVPSGKVMAGCLSIDNEGMRARFREEAIGLIQRKSITIKQGKGFTLSFNPEKNTYRITLSVDARQPDWASAAAIFTDCWACLEEREGDA